MNLGNLHVFCQEPVKRRDLFPLHIDQIYPSIYFQRGSQTLTHVKRVAAHIHSQEQIIIRNRSTSPGLRNIPRTLGIIPRFPGTFNHFYLQGLGLILFTIHGDRGRLDRKLSFFLSFQNISVRVLLILFHIAIDNRDVRRRTQ